MSAIKSNAEKYFETQIKKGREPLYDNVKERVIRFCGKRSDVTHLSVKKYF